MGAGGANALERGLEDSQFRGGARKPDPGCPGSAAQNRCDIDDVMGDRAGQRVVDTRPNRTRLCIGSIVERQKTSIARAAAAAASPVPSAQRSGGGRWWWGVSSERELAPRREALDKLVRPPRPGTGTR